MVLSKVSKTVRSFTTSQNTSCDCTYHKEYQPPCRHIRFQRHEVENIHVFDKGMFHSRYRRGEGHCHDIPAYDCDDIKFTWEEVDPNVVYDYNDSEVADTVITDRQKYMVLPKLVKGFPVIQQINSFNIWKIWRNLRHWYVEVRDLVVQTRRVINDIQGTHSEGNLSPGTPVGSSSSEVSHDVSSSTGADLLTKTITSSSMESISKSSDVEESRFKSGKNPNRIF